MQHHGPRKDRSCACLFQIWCSGGDSNPHGLLHTPLKRARLPITPPELICQKLLVGRGRSRGICRRGGRICCRSSGICICVSCNGRSSYGIGIRIYRASIRCRCRRRVRVAREHRDVTGQGGHRQQQSREHEQHGRCDRYLRKYSCRSTRAKRRAGNVAREQCSGIGFARLQQNCSYEHDAREKKYKVQEIFQLI